MNNSHNNSTQGLNSNILMKRTVSLEECRIITKRIKEENNKNGPHMIEFTPEKLLETANTHGCCAIKTNDQLIGFIKLMPTQKNETTLLEWGSICIEESYRKQGLGKILIETILDIYKDKPIYSVSNVEIIQKINQSLGQHKYTPATVPKKILNIIEIPGKLLNNDIIYTNELLHILIQKSG